MQQLVASGFGQIGPELYAKVATRINQAVLGLAESTAQFKQQQQLPKSMSVPDVLNVQGQVARCYAETCFQKLVVENMQRLREMSKAALLQELMGLQLKLRQEFVSTGMGHLQTKILTGDEAKERKKFVQKECKRQKLIQETQQPRVECTA